jgi:hypothetical protein
MCKIKNNERNFIGETVIPRSLSLRSNLNAGSKCCFLQELILDGDGCSGLRFA